MNYCLIVFAAVVVRLLSFLIFENWEIVNDSGLAVKLAGEPAYLDYAVYKKHIYSVWSEIDRPINFLRIAMKDMMEAWQWLLKEDIKPGPFFSLVLKIFSYDSDRNYLANIYLMLGCLLAIAWARMLAIRGGNIFFQLLLACYPALVYYSFLVSTDLIYAVLIAVFYTAAWGAFIGKKSALFWCMLALFAAVMTRPNGISLIPILYLLILRDSCLRLRLKLFLFFIWGLLGVYMLVYYLPYFWVHEKNAAATNYWGILPEEFNAGLITFLPIWMSQFFSVFFFGLSKLIYSVGLRPSYADVNTFLVVARALPGVVLLPGLIYGALRGHWFDKVFLLFFLLPVYVGAAQERYILAVTPLLILWGGKVYELLFIKLRERFKLRCPA
jgi:hypothetical protein